MLQTRTVDPRTLGILKELMAMPVLDRFYLVGGTALALQLGHRVSVDLDLFTEQPFDTTKVAEAMAVGFDFSVESESPTMLVSNVDEVKVDFVKMGYPILFPSIVEDGVRMLDLRDIAPMKLKAIAQRGSKKDYFDLFFLLDRLSLDEMLQLFEQKFKGYGVFSVIKSLTYFEDAEQSPDPVVFDKETTWLKVKAAVRKAAKGL